MDLREIHMIGAQTREWMVSPTSCPAMAHHGIVLLGISEAQPGFHFVRVRPQISQVLLCHGGSGEVLVDGVWEEAGPDCAYLTPPRLAHAYRAHRGRWEVAWIGYDETRGEAPVIDGPPRRVLCDHRQLLAAMRSLQLETAGPRDPAIMAGWVHVIDMLVQHRIIPQVGEGRLWRVWEGVETDLAHPWRLHRLAELAGMSHEHLRRLCLAQTGRSPLAQVTHLRMMRASVMLLSSDLTIERVAAAVGYDDAFAFSTAFKRAMGLPPSRHRRLGRSGGGPTESHS